MRLSKSGKKKLFVILGILVIASLVLSACTPGGGLSGAAGADKGKGKGSGDNNNNDDTSKGKSGDDNNNDDTSGKGKSGDNNNDDTSGKGKSGDDNNNNDTSGKGKSGDDNNNDDTSGKGKSGDDNNNNDNSGKGKGSGDDDDDDTGGGDEFGKGGHTPVTLCHATGSSTNPYVEITIDKAGQLNGHDHHKGDIIPAPSGGCPSEDKSPTKTPHVNLKITLCHRTGSAKNPYVEITVADDGWFNGHIKHSGDIMPAPAGGCPTGEQPTDTPAPSSTPGPSPTPGPTDTPGPSPTPGPTATPTEPATPPPDLVVDPKPELFVCQQFILFHTFRDGDLEVYRLDGVEGDPTASLFNLSNSAGSEDSRPTRSFNDEWVVFESNRDGNVELYLTESLGISVRRLTNTTANNINPMFLADNETVIFQSDRNGNWDLFSVNIYTGEEVQLTSDSNDDTLPFASPNPEWVVFQSNRLGNQDLFLLNVLTGEEFQLTRETSDEIFPAWSPDGTQIAYLAQGGLYTVAVTGGSPTLIAGGSGANAGNHSWSPDGTRLAYQVDNSGNVDVFTYDLRNNTEYQLTDFGGADSAPTWDCGGTNVSFTSTRDGNPNIFQVFWQGGDQSNLTIDPATDKWSEWSPSNEHGSQGH